MRKISFVIPCYRSSLTLQTVVDEIRSLLSGRMDYDYEIVLVDDGSPDDTFAVIAKICNEDVKVKGIRLAKNFGQPSATLAGLSCCTGEVVAYADDDGQTPIDHLFSLLEKLDEGYDVVFAKYKEKMNTVFQNIGSKVNSLMADILIGKPRKMHFGNFWVSRRFVVQEIVKCRNPYPYLGGLFLSVTKNMAVVPTNHRKRLAGKSNYTLKKMVSLWLNGFTAFSVKPLRIATIMGCVCSFLGFAYIFVIITIKLLHPMVPVGYSSLLSILLFIGGLIMIMLGLIGEYIGRIYININNTPQYVIKNSVNMD